MRILFFSQSFLPHIGGAEIALHHIAEGLSQQGVSCVILTHRTREAPFSYPHRYQVRYYRSFPGFRTIGLRLPWFRFCLKRAVKQWKPTLVHAWCAWPPGYCAVTGKQDGSPPVIITAQGIDLQKEPSVNYGYRLNPRIDRLLKASIPKSDAVIAISPDMRNAFLECGALESQVCEIPNPAIKASTELSKAEARTVLGLPQNEIVLLLVGRLHEKKRFDVFLRSFLQARITSPKLNAVFVGRGCPQLSEMFADAVEATGVHLFDSARPLGLSSPDSSPVSHLETFYSAADALVMPSAVEGSPLACLEALQAGLPVFAANEARIDTSLVSPEGPVFQFDPTDSKSLLELVPMLSEEGSRSNMASKAQESSDHFSLKTIVDQHIRLYEKFCD